ncbi:MAG TPA: hypothetical protein VIZ68_07920, partial [Thermoplasmata archaeon]
MRSTLALGAVGLLLVAGLIPTAAASAGSVPSPLGSIPSGRSVGPVSAGPAVPVVGPSSLGGDWPTYLGN